MQNMPFTPLHVDICLGFFLHLFKKRKKMLGIKPICMHLVHIKRCRYWILQIKQKSVEWNNIILEPWWKHTVMNNAADSIYSTMITGSLIAHNWLLTGCYGDVHCWCALLRSSSRWQQRIVLYVCQIHVDKVCEIPTKNVYKKVYIYKAFTENTKIYKKNTYNICGQVTC